MPTATSPYEHFEREDARHFGLDGYGRPTSRQLRDHLSVGGGMVEYLADRLSVEALEISRVRGLLFAAFLDCLTEGRPYSLIPRNDPPRFDWAAAKRVCGEQREAA